MVARLVEYRETIQRAAAGEHLVEAEVSVVEALLGRLSMPSGAWRRDIATVLQANGDLPEHRRAELVTLNPHLFGDPVAWAQKRIAEDVRRRLWN